jgi:hypothetical protein
MEAQGGEETDDRRRYSGGGENYSVMLADLSFGYTIPTGAHALQLARSSHPSQSFRVDAPGLGVARTDEGARTRQFEEASVPLLTLWYSATSHI